ncbi:MAG TPA: hypothetical protein VFN51_02525 [Candidatus Saccharimonadales bacterium]|nr:hypothetical protein [Candidatus Saccharimonadales bacterium]
MEQDKQVRIAKLQPDLHEQEQITEPKYPLLDASEVWDGQTDLKNELAVDVRERLREEEVLIDISPAKLRLPSRKVSSLEILMKAAHASSPDEIGNNGPTVASVSFFEDNSDSRYQRQHGRDDLYAAMDVCDIPFTELTSLEEYADPVVRDYLSHVSGETYPKLLETVVLSLAASQGMREEAFVEEANIEEGLPYGFEKPGSIILVNFEDGDPLGRKFMNRKGWRPRFYASADAPGLFIDAIASLYAKDNNFFLKHAYEAIDGNTYSINHAFDLTVRWLTSNMDHNPAGLVYYSNPYRDGRGMRNQGWKDSAEAMVHKDGNWADSNAGVAPIEMQAQAVISLRKAAAIYRQAYSSANELADDLERRADKLLKFILNDGWIEDESGGYFAMGWDRVVEGGIRRIETRSVDMHYMLRVLDMGDPYQKEMVHQTVQSLTSRDMLTRWGNRVMSRSEAAYGDYRYHCGVWPDKSNRVAESMAACGFYGLDKYLGRLTSNLIDRLGFIPEHIAGVDSAEPAIPKNDLYVYNRKYSELYLVEQIPPLWQTWGASSELGKIYRHLTTPQEADADEDRQFEKKIIEDIAGRYSTRA